MDTTVCEPEVAPVELPPVCVNVVPEVSKIKFFPKYEKFWFTKVKFIKPAISSNPVSNQLGFPPVAIVIGAFVGVLTVTSTDRVAGTVPLCSLWLYVTMFQLFVPSVI